MPALLPPPSAENVDRVINAIASDIVNILDPDLPGAVSADKLSALAYAGSFLLAYRARRVEADWIAEGRLVALNPDPRGRLPEQMIRETVAKAMDEIGGGK